jgi:hypothetical protein
MIMTKPEKRSLFGHRRCFPIIFAAYMGALATSQADNVSVYLPVVGPSPLRFRPAFIPSTNLVVALSPTPVKPTAPLPVEKEPAPAAPAPVIVHEPAPKTEQTNTVVEPPRPDGVVSPQMLLKYFNHPTNGNAAGVNAPLDFNPPRPVEPPSSKAEYSTPPH